jgi:hypothetical protein
MEGHVAALETGGTELTHFETPKRAEGWFSTQGTLA